MCTLILHHEPGSKWPLLVGANRDESPQRAWLGPARHWPERPGITAGKDVESGGSWLGVNDAGMFATLVNEAGTLGTSPFKQSRGGLVLDALSAASATEAAKALEALDPKAYKGFFLLVADKDSAHLLHNKGSDMQHTVIEPGTHILSPHGLDNPKCPRFAKHMAAVRTVSTPRPYQAEWSAWQDLLAIPSQDEKHRDGFLQQGDRSTTVSSSLVAIGDRPEKTQLLFAAGRPGTAPYQGVDLSNSPPEMLIMKNNGGGAVASITQQPVMVSGFPEMRASYTQQKGCGCILLTSDSTYPSHKVVDMLDKKPSGIEIIDWGLSFAPGSKESVSSVFYSGTMDEAIRTVEQFRQLVQRKGEWQEVARQGPETETKSQNIR